MCIDASKKQKKERNKNRLLFLIERLHINLNSNLLGRYFAYHRFIMTVENITENIIEKVELAANVGIKVANVVGDAFETTVADADQASSSEETTWMSYLTSFGIHIAMIIIVILLKWQYGIHLIFDLTL